jgi:flagellar basal body-associated protein FliL
LPTRWERGHSPSHPQPKGERCMSIITILIIVVVVLLVLGLVGRGRF